MIRLGIDVFSLRSQGWSAVECLEYCAAQGVEVVQFSEPRFLGPLEDSHLRQVRAAADRLGLALELGMLSICPTSGLFDACRGSAEEQLTRMIHAARVVGSPLVRAVLGNRHDRRSAVPMEAHIENTVRVLKRVRNAALDAGIRIAIENHSGDLRACELKQLVEAAGTDFVGVCLDSGNLPLTFDFPLAGLELLSPYVITTHIRDTRIWRTPDGIAVYWVPAGQGNVGFEAFLRRLVEVLPGCPALLETIVFKPIPLDCFKPGFWTGFPSLPAAEFADFLQAAERGVPEVEGFCELYGPPERERRNAEASLQYCIGSFNLPAGSRVNRRTAP